MDMYSRVMHHEMRGGQVSLQVQDGDSLEMLSVIMILSAQPMVKISSSNPMTQNDSDSRRVGISFDLEIMQYEL